MDERNRARRLNLWAAAAIAVLLAFYVAALAYSRPRASGKPLRYDRFVDLVERDRVLNAEILDRDGLVVGRYLTEDGETTHYRVNYFNAEVVREGLSGLLVNNNVPTNIDKQFAKSLVEPLTLMLPTLIFIVVIVYFVLSWRWGTGLFASSSGARRVEEDGARTTFADVAGQDEAVAELRELAEFLRRPESFTNVGLRVPKGILLYGPPGCGKTLLARALAGEAGVAFFEISGSDFMEMYVGVGAARVRELFKEARAAAPAVVFIDEIDSIGRLRGRMGPVQSHSEHEQTLNQILAELDGFSSMEGIVVLAATNRPDVLDPALLRPGRFDRTLGLELPDEDARLEILHLHARGKQLAPGVDLRAVARTAHGMAGADLAAVMNDAARAAARANRARIEQADLEHAFTALAEAPERRKRLTLHAASVGRRPLRDENVTFADVAGADDAVAELTEVRDYLADPERFLRLGARAPRGILLIGPPGCGKTLLARAVAGEADASFLSASASEFVEVFVGEGAARVRDLFAEARSSSPSIVFIDEIDSVGRERGRAGGRSEIDQTLNQILIELDGFRVGSGTIVMAATNRPDILDPALVRPGRFDRQVVLDAPDRAGRTAILEIHGRGKPLAGDVDFDRVAGLTSGASGADLENVLNEAALLAARAGAAEISMSFIEEGIERALLGVGARTRLLSAEEKQLIAVHEAGHALVGVSLPNADPPHKVTIVPRGRALGYMWNPDQSDRTLHTRSRLIDLIATSLAGRTAEEIVFGDVADGSSPDLKHATGMARRMVCELGMSEKLGPLHYTFDDGSNRSQPNAFVSEDVASTIDSEIRAIVEEARRRARDAIESHRRVLDRFVDVLLEKETLSAAEIEDLFNEARRPKKTARVSRAAR